MIFKRSLSAAAFAMFIAGVAVADTSSMNAGVSGMGILENDYVRAGVNGTAGTFGSGGNTSPGLLFDSTGTGTFNTAYDYLTPGSPFDGFAVKVDGTNYANNNGRSNSITGDGNGLTDGTDSLSWTGGVSGVFNITNTYSLGATNPYIDITSSITMLTDATTLSFGRHIDPDARAAAGDSSSTDNVLGYGAIPSSNVAFSEALVSRYALGLYSTDSNVDAGISGWSQEADAYTENTVDGDGSLTNTGDNTIGLSWIWTGVSTGDILTASYAYIFGPSAFAAASDAVDGGAGGGADILTGTLEDVGSATDAASGAATPVITTDTIVDTTRPVLTATVTHHESTVASGVQTIERELTTTTTTPMRTVTYTDGVETGSVVATSVVSSAVTDPGSFVGRVDQGQQMFDLDIEHTLGIANGVQGGRIETDMAHGYNSTTNVGRLGFSIVTDEQATISAGANRLSTSVTGADSTGNTTTMHIAFGYSKDLANGLTVGGTLNRANTDVAYARTIGDFAAAGTTSGTDTWANLTVGRTNGTLRPFVGITVGQETQDAYSETGDIQAVLSRAGVDRRYNYGTIGFNADLGILEISAARSSNDISTVGVAIDHTFSNNTNIFAGVDRIMHNDNTSNSVRAGVAIQF